MTNYTPKPPKRRWDTLTDEERAAMRRDFERVSHIHPEYHQHVMEGFDNPHGCLGITEKDANGYGPPYRCLRRPNTGERFCPVHGGKTKPRPVRRARTLVPRCPSCHRVLPKRLR